MATWCKQGSATLNRTHCVHIYYSDGWGQAKTQQYQGLLFYRPDWDALRGLAAVVLLEDHPFPRQPWLGFEIPVSGSAATITMYSKLTKGVTGSVRTVAPTAGGLWSSTEGELGFVAPWWITYTKTVMVDRLHEDRRRYVDVVGPAPMPA
jgi:hypothetical protein